MANELNLPRTSWPRSGKKGPIAWWQRFTTPPWCAASTGRLDTHAHSSVHRLPRGQDSALGGSRGLPPHAPLRLTAAPPLAGHDAMLPG